MTQDPARAEIASALDSLAARLADAEALDIRATDRAALEQAVERARSRLLGGPEPILTVALAGGTGVGKSTLVNALAGSTIAEASETRPTTTRIRVYHHRSIPEGGLPSDLGADALFVAHDREELRRKVIVDTPDLDSFVIGHRETTRRLLKAASLVLYVFSPEKYLEERTWSILREEHRYSASAAVLNKADRIPPDEIEKLTADLRQRFASIGLGEIRAFRVSARAHARDGEGEGASAPTGGDALPVDETRALRDFLERELKEGEIARMIRTQRARVVDGLVSAVDRIAPSDLAARIAEVEASVSRRAEAAADAVAEDLAERLAAIEDEFGPLAILKQHERFRGPLRAWLGMTDFFRHGLPGLVRRLLGRGARGEAGSVRRLLGHAAEGRLADTLQGQERSLQGSLYKRGLPVRAWVAMKRDTDGRTVAAEIAEEIEARFDVAALADSPRTRAIAFGASALGLLVPFGLAAYALYLLGVDFLDGRYTGLAVVGHYLGGMLLYFVLLHGLVTLLLPGVRGHGRGTGRTAIREVLAHTLEDWLRRYRTLVDEEARAFREPLGSIRSHALDDLPPVSVEPARKEPPSPVVSEEAAPSLDEEGTTRLQQATKERDLASRLQSAAVRGTKREPKGDHAAPSTGKARRARATGHGPGKRRR